MSLIDNLIHAVRNGAKLHPLPKEGERMDSREFQIAEAYGMASALADELERMRTAADFTGMVVPVAYLQETTSKRFKRVPIDYQQILRIEEMLIREFEKTGMRTSAVLVLVANTTRVYARMANRPIEDIMRTVSTFARQLSENRPLDSREGED